MVILGWCLSSKTMVRLRSVIYRYNASHSPLYILSFGTVGVENVHTMRLTKLSQPIILWDLQI